MANSLLSAHQRETHLKKICYVALVDIYNGQLRVLP